MEDTTTATPALEEPKTEREVIEQYKADHTPLLEGEVPGNKLLGGYDQ